MQERGGEREEGLGEGRGDCGRRHAPPSAEEGGGHIIYCMNLA